MLVQNPPPCVLLQILPSVCSYVHFFIRLFAHCFIQLLLHYFACVCVFHLGQGSLYVCFLAFASTFFVVLKYFCCFSKNITQILKYLQFDSNKEKKDI